jgi:hypothetical protein
MSSAIAAVDLPGVPRHRRTGLWNRQLALGRLAYAVWVEAPDEVRVQRGLARDHGQDDDVAALWRSCMAKERAFFAADGTRGPRRSDRADRLSRAPAARPSTPRVLASGVWANTQVNLDVPARWAYRAAYDRPVQRATGATGADSGQHDDNAQDI